MVIGKADVDSLNEDNLIEAHTVIATLGLVADVKVYLDAEADKLAESWFEKYRVQSRELSDERQDIYRGIKDNSEKVGNNKLIEPKSWMEATTVLEADNSTIPIRSYEHHLLCDEDGKFPAELNAWEHNVLTIEMSRQSFLAWYRNPSRSSHESLGVVYEDGDNHKIVRPDFIFFSIKPDNTVSANIIDPHGTQFSDALPKLKGLASYAETYSEMYGRIEAVALVRDKLRVLDMKEPATRKAVAEADDAYRLYEGNIANNLNQ